MIDLLTHPTVLLMYENASTRSGGAPIILNRLLTGYAGRCVTLTSRAHATAEDRILKGTEARFAPWMASSGPITRRLARYANIAATPMIARAGQRLAAEYHVAVILTSPLAGGEFFMAAHRLSKQTGIPLVVYLMDDWTAGAPRHSRVHGWLARSRMGAILTSAVQVWTISDAMAADIAARFGLQSQVLAPVADIRTHQAARAARPHHRSERRALEIIYSGAIYDAQADAVRNLVDVLEETQGHIHGTTFKLTVYTHVGTRSLNRMGINRPWLSIGSAALDEMPTRLASADIAFLPFSFDERLRQTTATSFPTKTADYLASGLPVLVHAPPWATVTRYAQANGFGIIVDRLNRGDLVAALCRLSDASTRALLGDRGLATAYRHHDLPAARARLVESLQAAGGMTGRNRL
jgi:hypothetical protein